MLVEGKNFKFDRLGAEDQYMLDNTVSSTVDGLFGCGFTTPKAFFILPKKANGVHKWLGALDNVVKLLTREVEELGGGGGDDAPLDLASPPSPPTPKVTSIRDELYKALKLYGETRFNLFWVDEVSGEAKRDEEDVAIEMSFLNALR